MSRLRLGFANLLLLGCAHAWDIKPAPVAAPSPIPARADQKQKAHGPAIPPFDDGPWVRSGSFVLRLPATPQLGSCDVLPPQRWTLQGCLPQ